MLNSIKFRFLGKNLSLFLILFLSLAFFQSCVKEDTNPPNDQAAPIIPPMETFLMPFQGFNESEVDTSEVTHDGADSRSVTFRNWAFAGGNVLVWNIVLVANMAIPVASFAASFNHSSMYTGNGIWAWTYDFNAAGAFHTATLTGEFVNGGDDVQWIMTISKAGGFSNFEYYRGVVAIDRSEANWTLNHQPNNPQSYLSIHYLNDETSGESSIRYTNIIPGAMGNGDYIEYSIQSGNDFNRAYDVYRINEDNFLDIEWDEPARNGRVKNLLHFGDEDWHCWDVDKLDIDC
jgi:hypothetical protein